MKNLVLLSLFAAGCGASGASQAASSNVVAADQAMTSTLGRIDVAGLTQPFSVEQIAPHTFVMHAYANATLIETPRGLVMVDTMLPPRLAPVLNENDLPNMQATLAQLKTLGRISTTTMAAIFYTHWHPDHAGNTDAFRQDGTLVVGGRGTLVRVSTPQLVKFFPIPVPALPAAFWPTDEVSDASSFPQLGNVSARYHPYSHTSTDISVWFADEKIACFGDLVLNDWYAFTDVDNGGSTRGLIASTQLLIDSVPADYKIVPGHNEVMTRVQAQAWLDKVRVGLAYVSAQIALGLTLDQIQAKAALTSDQGGFPADLATLESALLPRAPFVEWVYRDLTERDPAALESARQLAELAYVSGADMASIVQRDASAVDHAASTTYDTLVFEVNELKAIDAAATRKILSAEAVAAFSVYDKYVQTARAQHRAGLTDAELEAMDGELAAFR